MFGRWDGGEEYSQLATPVDAMREYAANVGFEPHHINSQWILTDYDVWVVNPHYRGRPQPHPEEGWEGTYEEYADLVEREEAEAKARAADPLAGQVPFDDENCPF